MPQGSTTSSCLQQFKLVIKCTLSVFFKTNISAVILLISIRPWSTTDLAISHWTFSFNKIKEQRTDASMLFNPPCLKKVSKCLQQVAELQLSHQQFHFSTTSLNPPQEEPKHTSKTSDTGLTCKLLEMTQWQCLPEQQQMLKQKLQQQIPCELASARTWSMLSFLPEYMTYKQVTEQGQASWKTSLNFVDVAMTQYFRHCNCFMSLLY